MKSDYKIIEFILGLGFGLGYLTQFRFAGPVGVPELMVFWGFIILFLRRPKALFIYSSKLEMFVKSYLVFSTVIVLPIVTGLTYIFASDINGSAPEYVAGFIFGLLLMIWISDAIKNNMIDMSRLTLWFAFAFILSNLLIIYFGIGFLDDSARYKGGAKNPNQLTFYAATLGILLVVYCRRFSLYAFPLVLFIVLKAESDAYILALVVISFFYILFLLYYSLLLQVRLSFGLIFGSLVLCFIALTVFLYFNFNAELFEIWVLADEGDARRFLMMNGFLATLDSPFWGFGAGSFSGVNSPFQGVEAHNTFLDFSMQFGFLYSFLLYAIMLAALFSVLKKREFLVAAFLIGFIESGLFHFSGRHFIFWAEMAVFWQYAFPKNLKTFVYLSKMTAKA